MHRTLIIRREYLHYIPKYARYEKRHKNLAAHVSPAFRVEEGDQVTVGQCRPLSKTVCAGTCLRRVLTRHADKGRSDSTFSECSPGLARRSRSSASSKRLFFGINGVMKVFVFSLPVGGLRGNCIPTRMWHRCRSRIKQIIQQFGCH